MKHALILCEGALRDNLRPGAHQLAELIGSILEVRGFDVRQTSLEALPADGGLFAEANLNVMLTGGRLGAAAEKALLDAVAGGAGVVGLGEGVCELFPENPELAVLAGGRRIQSWAARPLDVAIREHEHPVAHGIDDFYVTSAEPYFMMDPAALTLATVRVNPTAAPWLGDTVMPVAWVKRHDRGRVFFSALGATLEEYEVPQVTELVKRGLLWAAR